MPIQRSRDDIEAMFSKVQKLKSEHFKEIVNDFSKRLYSYGSVLSLTCSDAANAEILPLRFYTFLSELPSEELSGYMCVFELVRLYNGTQQRDSMLLFINAHIPREISQCVSQYRFAMQNNQIEEIRTQALNTSTIAYPQFLSTQNYIVKPPYNVNVHSSLFQYYFQFQRLLFQLNNDLFRLTGSLDALEYIYNFGEHISQDTSVFENFHTVLDSDFRTPYFRQVFALRYAQCWAERLEIIKSIFNDIEYAKFIDIYNAIHSAGTEDYSLKVKLADSVYFFDIVAIDNGRNSIRLVTQHDYGELGLMTPTMVIDYIKMNMNGYENAICNVLHNVAIKTIGTFLLTDFKYTEIPGATTRHKVKQLITCDSIPQFDTVEMFAIKFQEGSLHEVIIANDNMLKELYALRYAQLSCNYQLLETATPEGVEIIARTYAVGHLYFRPKQSRQPNNSIILHEINAQQDGISDKGIYTYNRDYCILMRRDLNAFMMVFATISQLDQLNFDICTMASYIFFNKFYTADMALFTRRLNDNNLCRQCITEAPERLKKYLTPPLAISVQPMSRQPLFAPLTLDQMLIDPSAPTPDSLTLANEIVSQKTTVAATGAP
jgi:hypothetical protein